MRPGLIIASVAAVLAIAFGVFMVDIDQTEEASMPDVDISVEGGNLPEFEAETGDIEVGTTTIETTVPTIDIVSPEEDNRTASND
ncbi:hypothetical protein [uncultured Roseobacter sp.]|uniref:hypothetical protein n=1 Tax=uncultured Roseobacter sp. TaxID=114847 RepID=UPI002638CF65|nr:hypothetical protein [uncultured Roseobacter sp.]